MPVFIRKDSKDGTYSYEFRLRGHRFSGNTRKTSEREALKVERQKREEAALELANAASFQSDDLTFEVAVTKYWDEVAQHHKNNLTTLWALDWLAAAIGRKTKLSKINDRKVAELVAKRRNELIPNRKVAQKISPATVNRTMTQPLREMLIRAAKVWRVKTNDINWSQHLLAEKGERVREASIGEENQIMSELERGYDVAVRFAFLSGCRRMEILGLTWANVDFFGKTFTVTGKGNKVRIIPMSQAIFDLLWDERNHHKEKVFTFVAKRTLRKPEYVRGERYPLTESGLKSAMRRAVSDAGVENFRFHDTRHTAATRILRASNLRVAQKLLGHTDIKTTTKYAHAMMEDVRSAMDAMSATEKASHYTAEDVKQLKNKGE
ncbi:tyrosine-type recombinase/integrase [Brucella pseudogrignonensis]|uniref:Phage integrase family protein n=1 Tax=Brucella pseudogrignonensis TaxID=419475 RepID=A0A256GG25_9HYPH|nr:site-specific integrase [Brucella pseudogrignonensis]OYR25856.1 phage integrase family protein [Brucella pseudogrignonensis]